MVYFSLLFYDRTVVDDSAFHFYELIDGKLRDGAWARWHRSTVASGASRAAAARAWCASTYWDRNTPNLEDWRVVAEDLKLKALSEAYLGQMAQRNRYRISFPPIPFFEERQVRDLLRGSDLLAAAALAEQLASLDSLLTVRPEDAAELCWRHAVEPTGLEYAAWCWLIGGNYRGRRDLPSVDGVRALWKIDGPRGEQARTLVEESAAGLADGSDARARAVLAAIAKLRTVDAPTIVETASAETPKAVIPDAAGDSVAPYQEALCQQLFLSPLDMNAWKSLEGEVKAWSNPEPARHPMVRMARHLRDQHFPAELDDAAWGKLEQVLTECSGLLRTTAPAGPLPALLLAACVRSTVSVGEIAVGLAILPGKHRTDATWWKALWSGLALPLVRRDGWCLADDRPSLAQDAVRAQRGWLSPSERQAYDSAIGWEND